MPKELMPVECPFCGGPAVTFYPREHDVPFATCGAPQPLGDERCIGKHIQAEVYRWNTRASLAPAKQEQGEVEYQSRWRREAEQTLDHLARFLQHVGAPHRVDWREWIDQARIVFDTLKSTPAPREPQAGVEEDHPLSADIRYLEEFAKYMNSTNRHILERVIQAATRQPPEQREWTRLELVKIVEDALQYAFDNDAAESVCIVNALAKNNVMKVK